MRSRPQKPKAVPEAASPPRTQGTIFSPVYEYTGTAGQEDELDIDLMPQKLDLELTPDTSESESESTSSTSSSSKCILWGYFINHLLNRLVFSFFLYPVEIAIFKSKRSTCSKGAKERFQRLLKHQIVH